MGILKRGRCYDCYKTVLITCSPTHNVCLVLLISFILLNDLSGYLPQILSNDAIDLVLNWSPNKTNWLWLDCYSHKNHKQKFRQRCASTRFFCDMLNSGKYCRKHIKISSTIRYSSISKFMTTAQHNGNLGSLKHSSVI